MKFCWILIVATVLPLASSVSTNETCGQSFRIESDIFVEGRSTPVSENLTLFTETKVYDFQLASNNETPIEVVIYDFENKHFVLLDPSRKVKYEIEPDELNYFVKSLLDDEMMRKKMPFMFQPSLDESFDKDTGFLTLRSTNIEYRCKGKEPKNSESMERYYEFIDQYARLNSTDPHKLPPFARLELNKAIVKRQWMPSTVEMKIQFDASNGKRKIEAKSKHYVIWKLSKKDHERIELARTMLNEFENVGLEKYRHLETTAQSVANSIRKR